MKNKKIFLALLPAAAITGCMLFFNACKSGGPADKKNADSTGSTTAPTGNNAGLKLQAGFAAAAIAENLGGTREIAVTPQGDIYVKLTGAKTGKGILFLHQDGDKA